MQEKAREVEYEKKLQREYEVRNTPPEGLATFACVHACVVCIRACVRVCMLRLTWWMLRNE